MTKAFALNFSMKALFFSTTKERLTKLVGQPPATPPLVELPPQGSRLRNEV